MPEIKRLIWLPTVRCNCNCVFCGERHKLDAEEVDCDFILKKIVESSRFKGGFLSITGGEPFLKENLPVVLAHLCNLKQWSIDITTNGTCVEQIEEFCRHLNTTDNLYFSVSIDGPQQVHDALRHHSGAFEKAIETIRILKNFGINCKINTVLQRENISLIDEFDHSIQNLLGQVNISYIPEVYGISPKNSFPYTDLEVERIFPHIQKGDQIGQVYLQKKGEVSIRNCHAGQKSFALSPDGKIYTCLTAFAYMSLTKSQRHFVGDLREISLDNAIDIIRNSEATCSNAVKECSGCWNICEVGNEMGIYNVPLYRILGENRNTTREDVMNCYRYILGREPESEDVVSWYADNVKDADDLRIAFLRSEEFREKYAALVINEE